MIPYLAPFDLVPFPDVSTALTEPNGLLCSGGDLTPERIVMAYRRGIFPWYSEGEPILWWSPNPRAIIPCDELHVSRSTLRLIRQNVFEIRHNTAFEAVMRGCAAPRRGSFWEENNDTWIGEAMIKAYCALYEVGIAHSYECWQNDELVGGIYGVKINGVFCGESMFSKATNASKVAIAYVAQCGDYHTIDCQIPNSHLTTLGARTVPREDFLTLLNQ